MKMKINELRFKKLPRRTEEHIKLVFKRFLKNYQKDHCDKERDLREALFTDLIAPKGTRDDFNEIFGLSEFFNK